MKLFDGLMNLLTGMGTGRDKTVATVFAERVLAEPELHAMYRDDWVAKKIVNIPAYDMMRKGWAWKAAERQIAALEAAEASLGLQQKVHRALVMKRLYGGAAIIVDDGGSPEKELIVDKIGRESVKALHAVSNKKLSFPDGLNDDIRSQFFGQPVIYQMTTATSGQIRIHPSRVVPFHGEMTPDTDVVEDWWGDSVLRSVYQAVQHAAKAPQGFSTLIDEAKIDIVGVKNLATQVSDATSRDILMKRWSLFNLGKSLNSLSLFDADQEEFITRQIDFSNHDKIIMAFMMIVSGAADIPATRMLGQSPSGLNATGESDLRNYYDSIESRQITELEPSLSRLREALIRHALGNRPAEIWAEYRSLWTPTAVEKATIDKTNAEAVKILFDINAVDPQALKLGVEGMIVESGLLPGFDRALKQAKAIASEGESILPEEEDESRTEANDAAPRTMYVSRPVLNADEIVAWAKRQGFGKTLEASDMHVTVAFSRAPVDWMRFGEDYQPEIEIVGGPRLVDRLGEKGAVALLFVSNALVYRHREFVEGGASWDHDDYQPHITLTYDGGGVDLDKIEPYRGRIVLGPERFEDVQEDWEKRIVEA